MKNSILKQIGTKTFSRKAMTKTMALLLFLTTWGVGAVAQDKKAEEAPYEGLVFKANSHWKMKFSGLVNTFYTLAVQGEDKAKNQPSKTYHSIQNGLNGALLQMHPSYTDGDFSITGNFMFSLGLNSHGFQGEKNIGGFTFSSIDVRQASVTVAHKKFGSVTFGRDFGLLGLDAILQDITFLGVGANWSFANPSYVTLAGIGYGYVFVDKFAQITYTTPSLGGLTASVGVFHPYRFQFTTIPGLVSPENPNGLGFHAKLNYQKSFSKKVALHLSSSLSTQQISEYKYTNASKEEMSKNNFQGVGVDVFANLTLGRFNLTGYYYYGNGVGSDGYMFRPIVQLSPSNVQKVQSYSYYGQLTYKTSNPRPWLLGVIYGTSFTGDQFNAAGNRDTEKLTYDKGSSRISGVVGWQVHPYIALRAEYTYQEKGLFATAPHYNIFVIGGTFYF